jgi:hypothetical protein
MAHQFDYVCGNEPTPQIMIQLIGCRITTAPPMADSERLKKTSARPSWRGKNQA